MAKKNEIDFEIFEGNNFCVFDTETTGLDSDYDEVDNKMVLREGGTPCSIIEVASMSFHDGKFVEFTSDICKPKKGEIVSPIAAATHGYTNRMLEKAPSYSKTNAAKALKKEIDNGSYIIAHNLKFDKRMLKIHGVEIPQNQCIDTLIVARHVFGSKLFGLEDTKFYQHLNDTTPENNTLQYYRYLMEMDDQPYFEKAKKLAGLKEIKPHTALSDVAILWIFTIILGNKANLTLEDMVRLTKTPVLQDKFLYGQKWKIRDMTYEEIIRTDFKTPWATTKKGYEELMWPFESGGMMADVEYSIIYHMGKGILNGNVPYSNGKNDYKQFIPLAIKYCFNREEILRGLELMGKEPSFLKKMWEISDKKIKEEWKTPIDMSIDPEKFDKYISKRENRMFLHRYAEEFRKDLLLSIAEEEV